MKHSPSQQATLNTIFQVVCQNIGKLHIYYRPRYNNHNGSLSTGVKRPGRETNHSCPTIAEAKKKDLKKLQS